ncbi:MAG: hypothetical protein HY698_20900 [Deltaproteobacteria bacterium]|nr:hypothetical protein [Deltaproteobacteria bacterium]
MLELVARMRREAFSRNRNFDAFAAADADGARARRVWRYLRSLEKDLSSASLGGETGVHLQIESHGDGGRRITIEVPSLHIRRVAIVNAEEYALLREHPDTRAVLDVAEGRRL